jgi:hypothetical protein
MLAQPWTRAERVDLGQPGASPTTRAVLAPEKHSRPRETQPLLQRRSLVVLVALARPIRRTMVA